MSFNVEVTEEGCHNVSIQANSKHSRLFVLVVSLATISVSLDVDQCVSYRAVCANTSLLNQKNVTTRECENRDRLTELYLRHVIPLPQRTLPNSRWGKRMERSQGRETPAGHRSDR